MSRVGAVAVDMGATSGRFAEGVLKDGRIEFRTVEQITHTPRDLAGRLVWDIDALMGLSQRAAAYASAHFSRATLGIDAWGVDHGFTDSAGRLLQAPVSYRDPIHAAVFAEFRSHRPALYAATGVQAQPFNTIYQLVARRRENPALADARWLILPDLIGFLMMGEPNYELTEASTTNLMGLDGQWSRLAFEIAGWPMPELAPRAPGELYGYVADRVRLASVGSHDTASAVLGLEPIDDETIFLNVGTWSLIGAVVDTPIASPAAEAANFTNERCVDGRVRFLKNVPGFWVVNRIHEELGVAESVPEWLKSANLTTPHRLDLLHDSLFNPDSMVKAGEAILGAEIGSVSEWAGVVLLSLVDTLAAQPPEIAQLTGRRFTKIRVGGGGSQSTAFCALLAERAGLQVLPGPVEATVLGNLAMQMVADGQIADLASARRIIAATNGFA